MNLIQTFMDSVDQNIFAEILLRLISVLCFVEHNRPATTRNNLTSVDSNRGLLYIIT